MAWLQRESRSRRVDETTAVFTKMSSPSSAPRRLGGPVNGTTSVGGSSVSWHDAVDMGQDCGPADTGDASAASTAQTGGGAVIASMPSSPRLRPGERFGPLQLCFEVAGKADQKMTLVWSPAPLIPGSAQPSPRYIALP